MPVAALMKMSSDIATCLYRDKTTPAYPSSPQMNHCSNPGIMYDYHHFKDRFEAERSKTLTQLHQRIQFLQNIYSALLPGIESGYFSLPVDCIWKNYFKILLLLVTRMWRAMPLWVQTAHYLCKLCSSLPETRDFSNQYFDFIQTCHSQDY